MQKCGDYYICIIFYMLTVYTLIWRFETDVSRCFVTQN